MPRKPKFAVGDFAVSKPHQTPVTVSSRKGRTMTVAAFPSGKPLAGTVTDKDLMTMREFEAWAPTQPWYKPLPPARSPQDLLDRVAEIAARVARRAAATTTPQPPAAHDEPDPPMPVVITRTLFVHEMATPDGEVRRRVPLFRGQKLRVQPDYEEVDGFDWLCPVEGGAIPLPPDAWEVDTSDVE
jgi:hypothetical protein